MKKINLVIAVLLVLLLPYAVSALGNISVSSSPSGATIFVDNVNKGTAVSSPFTVTNVANGTHVVVLQLIGYLNFTTNADVPDGGTFPISATLIPNTPAPTISSITPLSGYNTTSVSITNLAGSGFATTGNPIVILMKTGETNITATSVSAVTASKITCNFEITGKPAGYWTVVVTNPDGKSATLNNGFEIKNPGMAVTLTAITPNNGVVNNTVTITDLSGSGFLSTATIILRKNYENDIPGTAVTVVSATKITGSFNLNGRMPGTYDVCVLNDGSTPTCGPTFTINSAASTTNGSIVIKSSPASSKIFLDNVFQGYTIMTLNVTPGTYTVLVRSAGYRDYSESVKVTAGNTSLVIASLVLSPEVTTVVTTAPKTTVATVKTTAKSTAKVPTPWPSATATPASPVSIFVIIGSVGMGLVVLRKG